MNRKVPTTNMQLLTLWFVGLLLVANIGMAAAEWQTWAVILNAPVILLLVVAGISTREPRHPSTKLEEELHPWVPPQPNDTRPGSN